VGSFDGKCSGLHTLMLGDPPPRECSLALGRPFSNHGYRARHTARSDSRAPAWRETVSASRRFDPFQRKSVLSGGRWLVFCARPVGSSHND
jgi:hypothetical protein